MAGKSNTFEQNLLKLIFNGTSITGLADNAATSPLGSLYVSLHTSDPGDTGSQTTNEVTTAQYGEYVRKAVARTSAGWTVTAAGEAKPTADISFPACNTGTGTTITHFAVGTAVTGAGSILYSGPCTPTVNVVVGVTPVLTTGTIISED